MTTPAPAIDPLLTSDLGRAGPIGRVTILKAIEELRLGVREVPPGFNRGPRVDLYLRGVHNDGDHLLHFRPNAKAPDGWSGARWCGRFAKWCVDNAAIALVIPSPVLVWGDLASAYKWRERALQHGRWREAPMPGCVGLRLDDDLTGHVMLVARIDSEHEWVWTVEGNEDNAVMSRRRPLSDFTGGFVLLG